MMFAVIPVPSRVLNGRCTTMVSKKGCVSRCLKCSSNFADRGSAESRRQTGLRYGRGKGRGGGLPKEWKTEVGEEFRLTSVQGARAGEGTVLGGETCLKGP